MSQLGDYAYQHPSGTPAAPTAGNCHRDRPHWVRDGRGRINVERPPASSPQAPTGNTGA